MLRQCLQIARTVHLGMCRAIIRSADQFFLKLQFPTVSFLYFKMYGKLHYTSHCYEINCVGINKDATKKCLNLKKYVFVYYYTFWG